MKYKYFLEAYVNMYKKTNMQFPSNFHLNYNIKDIGINLDWIANELVPLSKKEDMQAYLEATEPESKIDVLLRLLHRNTNINNYFLEIEAEAKNSIRNKKFYEYYSEMMKVTKQVLDGKKTKERTYSCI